MTKQEVLARLCSLCSDVREKLGGPADCFCGENPTLSNAAAFMGETPESFYMFDERVLEFIESAVRNELKQVVVS